MALDIKVALSWVNYCRLCLQDEGLKIPIFEREGVTENIPKKIKECLNIMTYDGDPLPRMICFQCLSKLNTAYELHTKAMESFKLVLITLKPLKQFSTVKEYMKDCQFSLEDDELIKDTSVDKNIPKSAPARQLGIVGSTDEAVQQDQENPQEQVRGRVTRSRVGGRSPSVDSGRPPSADTGRTPSADGSRTPPADSGRITIVPKVENPSLVSSASTSKEPVFLVPLPPKPKPHDNHFHEPMDHDSNEDHCKRKRKRITDHYDEALMDSGGNLVLAAGGRRGESRYRDGKRKKIGPASRTRAQATCLPFPSSWQCVLCSCFFASHSMLRRHLSICLICQTCGLEFLSAKDKAVHEEDHMYVNLSKSTELLYKCDDCDRAFAAHLMLKMHMKYDHPESAKHLYADPFQPGVYADPVSPEGDADEWAAANCKCDSDEDGKPAKVEENRVEGHEICPKCSRPFVTKQRLSYHLLDHDQLIQCLFCPWKFPVGPGRRRHQRRMHGDKAEPVCFTCSVCRESFETKSILFLHKKNSHGKIELEDCGKTEGAGRKGELEHCHVCDKMIQPSKFMAHLLHHADDAYGGKPQSDGSPPNPAAAPKTDSKTESLHCPMCDVTSATQEQHRAHIAQKHIQQKSNSFRCDGCSQAFANVEAINRHSCPGKEKERQWKNCKHCGQNLSDDIVHVCDNECPICHKIFKSARGQRLHIQHKHDNSGAEDQANSESRSSGGDSAFEHVVVKEEKEDAEEMVRETAEPESARPEPAEPEATQPGAVEPDTAEPVEIPSDAETEPRSTPGTSPPPSNLVRDELAAPSPPNPSAESSSIQQDLTGGTEKAGLAKGMPKIRLRPPGALISELPTSLSAIITAPKAPSVYVKPPVSFRPFESPAPAQDVLPVQPFQDADKVTKSIVIRKNSGPGQSYSLHVTNVKHNSVTNTVMPAAKNNAAEPRVDNTLTSNAPPISAPANTPSFTMNTSSSLAGGVSVGGDVCALPSFSTSLATTVFDPLQNSSQIAPSSFISDAGASFPEVIPLDTPSVIMTSKPFSAHQSRMIRAVQPLAAPLNQNNSIRCVRISSLQPQPASSGMLAQTPSHQSNFDTGYGRLFDSIQPAPRPTEFNPVQSSSGASGREENLLRDVLLGRRTDQDYF